jgi:hypothetical protein
MTFTSDPSGITVGGLGLGAATISFGNIQAFGGTLPTGVTRTQSGNSFVIATPIDIQVTGIGIVNNSYTLAVKLTSIDLVDVLKVGTLAINSTSFTTLTSTATYLSFIPWTFSITVPYSASAGPMANTFNFLATGN